MSDSTEPVLGQLNKPKHAGGRPPKLTPLQRTEVYDAFSRYIQTTPDPTIPEFVSTAEICFDYDVYEHNLHDWQEFSNLIKRCIKKQEAFLLKEAGAGKYNPTIAIFRLKQPQHGYRDRFETDITSNGNDVGVGLTPEQADQLLKLRAAQLGNDTN